MAFVVLYDACVLHPIPLAQLLLNIAEAELVDARFILDECFDSIRARRPDADPKGLERRRAPMLAAFPSALVEGFEPLIEGLTLPDADDRHVLAAAIHAHAQVADDQMKTI